MPFKKIKDELKGIRFSEERKSGTAEEEGCVGHSVVRKPTNFLKRLNRLQDVRRGSTV